MKTKQKEKKHATYRMVDTLNIRFINCL